MVVRAERTHYFTLLKIQRASVDLSYENTPRDPWKLFWGGVGGVQGGGCFERRYSGASACDNN